MKPLLKIDGIADLHDARYCSAIGIKLLGFRPGAVWDPLAISEIMDWLSGPEGVGEFTTETPEEISLFMAASKLNWASLPISYGLHALHQIKHPLIIRIDSGMATDSIKVVAACVVEFPDAVFELDFRSKSAELEFSAILSGIWSRSLIKVDHPDIVFGNWGKNREQTWGFTLGAFVVDQHGSIDYASCDDFLEDFETMYRS